MAQARGRPGDPLEIAVVPDTTTSEVEIQFEPPFADRTRVSKAELLPLLVLTQQKGVFFICFSP